MLKSYVLMIVLLLNASFVAAQQSDDPNLKGVKDDPRMQKDMLRDKDTRDRPAEKIDDKNRKYEQEQKDKEKKEKEKEALRNKYEKEKNR